MKTFTEPNGLVDNPRYDQQRQASLSAMDIGTIDPPIVDIMKSFRELPCCFTLQSCSGHFIYADQQDRDSIERLPTSDDGIATVRYRIAYVALCLENSPSGRELLEDLMDIPAADPEFIQFGSADWFWDRQVNSYVLQVEPTRYVNKDWVLVGYREALHLQKVRDSFFSELRRVLDKRPKRRRRGPG